jgi:hypothetical protein
MEIGTGHHGLGFTDNWKSYISGQVEGLKAVTKGAISYN